ncbi:hypothetical protein [Paraconexibacter algicola]|uniref:Ig-like domain-containing protein n=1 Tax=Paraconexibacter algicola TaxID=2133960 RepID=A0A2T4UD75_9ACTN|nr:hypothetical protein [Paraconexibacter algicola]PTL55456.1 hypothetical protein C7Y72_17530 [Paraconexibacter algicola]
MWGLIMKSSGRTPIRRRLTLGLALAATAAGIVAPAGASAATAVAGNSTATTGSSGNLGALNVLGANHIFRTSLTYARTGVDNAKRTISTSAGVASGDTVVSSGTISQGGPTLAQVERHGTLTDIGASGYWTEWITVQNTEATDRTYDLYMYVDIDVLSSPNFDSTDETTTAQGTDGVRQDDPSGIFYVLRGLNIFGRSGAGEAEDISPTLDYSSSPILTGQGDRRMLLQFRVAIPAGASRTVAYQLAGGTTGTVIPASPPVANPTATISRPILGERIGLDRRVPIDFACTNATSCTATVDGTPIADGDLLPTTSLGTHNIVVTASNGGTSTTASGSYTVVIPSVSLSIAGSGELVNGGLGFRPADVDLDYTGSLTLSVTSDAGPSTITVQDLGNDPGYLVNSAPGTPGLLQNKLEARVGAAGYEAIGRNPLTLTTLTSPVVGPTLQTTSVDLRQRIAANEALRTGAYAKNLTFTVLATGP